MRSLPRSLVPFACSPPDMSSPSLSFLALYTKNTTKKAKTWLDGTITASSAGSNRARVVLKTENGLEIETDFVKQCVEGAELKLERHLVQVRALDASPH